MESIYFRKSLFENCTGPMSLFLMLVYLIRKAVKGSGMLIRLRTTNYRVMFIAYV
jgi:hypothetical protein